ncbi:hypothetical protein D3C72_615260 [compost metagenome]
MTASGIFNGIGHFALRLCIVVAGCLAQGVDAGCQASSWVVRGALARATRAEGLHPLALGVVAPAGLTSIGQGDAQEVAGGDIEVVVGLSAQRVDAGNDPATGIEPALRGAAVGLLDFDDAPKACLAFEVVDAGAPKAVGDGGAVLCIVKVVGQRALPALLYDFALRVVGVAHRRAAYVGMGGHAAAQLPVVLKAALQAGVAPIDANEFTALAVFVAHQGLCGKVWPVRVAREVHGDEPSSAVCSPAICAVASGAWHRFELKPVLPATAVLHFGDLALRVAAQVLGAAKAIGHAKQAQPQARYVFA